MNKLLKPTAIRFIGRGLYEVTQKAYDELASQALGPIESSTRYGTQRRECGTDNLAAKGQVNSEVGCRISGGKAAELYDLEYVVAEPSWELPEDRVAAIRELIRSGIEPRQVIKRDFSEKGLGGLLYHYAGSPYLALKAAGLADFEPWEMSKAPNGTFKEKEERVRAIGWLVEKLGKKPGDINKKDFCDNCLGGLLNFYYKDSPYRALRDAGLVRCPRDMKTAPKLTFSGQAGRVKAIKDFVERLGKDPREVTCGDFEENRLGGLLDKHYRDSPYLALKDAGLADFEPWEMKRAPNNTFSARAERIRAVNWLVEKLGKKPGQITGNDFRKNGLGGLLANYFRGSAYYALKIAGFVRSPKEMKNRPKFIRG